MHYVAHVTDHVLEIRGLANPVSSPMLITGVDRGPVRITIQLHDDPPPLDLDQWEDVVEFSVEVGAQGFLVMGLEDVEPALAGVGGVPPGRYRVRAAANGRSAAYDEIVVEPIEHYLIQLWSAGWTPPAIVSGPAEHGLVALLANAPAEGAHVEDSIRGRLSTDGDVQGRKERANLERFRR